MTSIRKIPTMLGSRRGNPLEHDRDTFEKLQEASFRKAVNDEELPVKMKHVRNLIIGTFIDKNCHVFWWLVRSHPPISTDVNAWKFCHTFHLLLRDGHPNVLREASIQLELVKNIGKHYSHLPLGYGPLIKSYIELLISKIRFHHRYPHFPGALSITPEELECIAEHDANNYFELAVEMLEYMEAILNLYETGTIGFVFITNLSKKNLVFRYLDPSRANSMTRMGQCRLAPLIPCIQDSSCLYDFTVRILFQLHKDRSMYNPSIASLEIDLLSGHRTRFNKQFHQLRNFYNGTRNLQYFKGLIQVPPFPEEPPNFLIEAELRHHVPPVVVVEDQVDGEHDALLIDTSVTENEPPPVPPHPHLDGNHVQNGSLAEVLAERESIIEALQNDVDSLKAELQRVYSETSHKEQQLRLEMNDLESHIAELDSELMAERQTRDSILVQVEAAAASAEAVTLLAQEETKRRIAEDKFSKMKVVYQKLRQEHIALIRQKADVDKQLANEKEKIREQEKSKVELQTSLKRMESQLLEQSRMQQNIASNQKELDTLKSDLNLLVQEKESLSSEREKILQKHVKEKEELECKVNELSSQIESVNNRLAVAIEQHSSCAQDKKVLESSFQEYQKSCTAKNELYINEIETLKQELTIENCALDSTVQELNSAKLQLNSLKEDYDEALSQNISKIKELELELSRSTEEKIENLKKLMIIELTLDNVNIKSKVELTKKDDEISSLEVMVDSLRIEKECIISENKLLSEKMENQKVTFLEEIEEKSLQLCNQKQHFNKICEMKEKAAEESKLLRESLWDIKNKYEDDKNSSTEEIKMLSCELLLMKQECNDYLKENQKLLVSVGDAKKEFKEENDLLKVKNTSLQNEIDDEKMAKEVAIVECQMMAKSLNDVKNKFENHIRKSSEEMSKVIQNHDLLIKMCLDRTIGGAYENIAHALSHFDHECHSNIKCTPEYTLLYENAINDGVRKISSSYCELCEDSSTLPSLIQDVETFSHYVASFLLYAKATSHASQEIEKGENLISGLEEMSEICLKLLDQIKTWKDLGSNFDEFCQSFIRCCSLVNQCSLPSVSQEDIAVMVEREMDAMDKAILEAVSKFSIMLEESRARETGMQLEVNEGILESCGELMKAVRVLVQRASELQREIVAVGKGSAFPKEFYKRNHRWTEGLISGAKAVAIACQALMSAADQVASGNGKFEEVIVASREIAASSMQLVMASRVKADRNSAKLDNLNTSAKVISSLTGTVVATAESFRDRVNEASTLDFSKLSLHSTKKLEMNTLVKVLETEKLLEMEREKLSRLRKHHYQLAGEVEGWENDDDK